MYPLTFDFHYLDLQDTILSGGITTSPLAGPVRKATFLYLLFSFSSLHFVPQQ